jgi:hypothetical protein
MGILPEGEILRVSRRSALVPLCVGLALGAAGIAITRLMMARGDSGAFMLLWSAIWFLGSAAGIVTGVTGLFRPPVFAHFTSEGVSFPSRHIRLVRWSDLRGVRLGLRTYTRHRTTQVAWRTPLILHVADPGLLHAEWKGFKFRHGGHSLGDGTAEILLKTTGCPISNEDLIQKLGRRAGFTPDLRSADPETATLGGVKLNQHAKRGGGAYLAVGVLIVLGVTFAGLGMKNLLQANASRDWPSTRAEIISAEIKTGSGGPRNSSTRYTPHITYRYTVEGKSYTSNRAAFVYSSSSDKAQAFIRRFPPGAQTPAYYDPADPANAVLVREGYGTLWIFVAFGTLFASVGVVLLKRLLAARRKVRT